MNVTKTISEFVVNTGFEDFPERAVTVAARAIMDCTGVALAGTREDCARKLADWTREMGGNYEAGVPSFGFRTSPPAAALVWGTAAHALDFDDVMVSLVGHPSVTLVPVIFSLARKYRADGRRMLEAYLVGLEVEGKIGRATSPAQYAAGWHATPTVGSLGAAAAAAKMAGLDAGQTAMAMGIAASMAGGLRQNFGTMTKPLHAGMAARNGVSAVMLAARGYTADEAILEARFGFANVFSGPGRHNLDLAVQGLGQSWEALDPGITIKKYPCCAFTHRSVDAVLKLREENRLEAGQVESVLCRTDRQGIEVLIHSRPRTGLEGKFSMQYCLAGALLKGKLGLEDFADRTVSEPAAQDLLSRVTVEELTGTSMAAQCSVVEIRDRSGRTCSCRVDVPRGAPGNPMTWEELAGKYRECAGVVLPPGGVEQTLELFGKMETLESADVLLDLLESAV